MRANQETLVAVARQHGTAVASSWRAERDEDGIVSVWHYSTEMMRVYPNDRVHPVSCGWQSMTDKCGVRKILRNVNGMGYADIFTREWTDEEWATVLEIRRLKGQG
jgi:hypothetical protein